MSQAQASTKVPTPLQSAIIATKHKHPDMTLREIAQMHDTAHPHVLRTLQEYGIDTKRVDEYKSARAEILAGMQERVLRAKFGTDEQIKDMNDQSAILLFNSCFNAERLERGQSTENHLNVNVIKQMDDRQAELEKMLQCINGAPITFSPQENQTQPIDVTGESTVIPKLTNHTLSDVEDPVQRRRGRLRKAR